MYKISIYGCAMFKKLVCQWVNISKVELHLSRWPGWTGKFVEISTKLTFLEITRY